MRTMSSSAFSNERKDRSTVACSIKSWIDAKSLEGRSDKTLQYYEDTANRLARFLDRDPKDATSDEIRAFLSSLKPTCSNVSINNIRRNLNSYYQYLEDEDVIGKSPMRRIHYIREEKRIKKAFSDDEIEVIFEHALSLRDKAILLFLASSAVRVGELVQIKKNDVDLAEREATVIGKGNKERTVFFDAKTKRSLELYLESRTDDSPFLFVQLNKPTSCSSGCIERMVRNVGLRAGVENVHPHRFRRTAATRALERGMPLEQVQKMLGHSSINTTLIYAEVKAESVKASHRKYLA